MIMPYLRFNGNCEEAFKFYAECFGGSICHLARLNNDPSNPVMHATVDLIEGGAVSGADTDEKLPDSYDILVLFKSRDEVDKVFAKLSQGATNVSEYKPHPPPDDNGGGAYLTDKYGYTWFLCA